MIAGPLASQKNDLRSGILGRGHGRVTARLDLPAVSRGLA